MEFPTNPDEAHTGPTLWQMSRSLGRTTLQFIEGAGGAIAQTAREFREGEIYAFRHDVFGE